MSEDTAEMLKVVLEKLNKLEKVNEEKDHYKNDLLKTKEKLRALESNDNTSELTKLQERLNAAEQEKAQLSNDRDTTVKSYKKQLEELTLKTHIKDVLTKHNGIPEFLEHHLLSKVKIVEDNGVQNVVVVDKSGNVVKQDNGAPASVETLVETYKKDPTFALAFKSNKVSGSGVTTGVFNEGASDQDNPWLPGQFNRTKQNLMLKSNPQLAEKLRKQAQAS